MSRSSDLHLLLSDYERMFGEQDEQERSTFCTLYSKGLLLSQKMQRFPADDVFVPLSAREKARREALLPPPRPRPAKRNTKRTITPIP